MKNVLGVIVGMVVGMIANMALIILNTVFYPLPEGMSMWKMEPEQLNEHIASLPQMAMILPLLAHLSQAFFGAWVAAKIGKSRPVLLAMIIGVLTLVGGIYNFSLLPDAPKWMMIELPLYLILAWKAGKMVEGSRSGNE